jgi:16S rRNA (adenine1518-N6/adenine1519-N6)-dimethyltransferase
MISKPSSLLAFLSEEGLSPKKSLSQNFLIDKNILHKIIRLADVQEGDLVLEIGPGPGALTEVLLAAGAEVIAVEKDEAFAEKLKRFPGVTVHSCDVRDFPFQVLPRRAKVVANLPYHLTSVILALLLPRKEQFSTLTFMVQEEVARRMTALPGGKDYSSLSVFVRFYSEPSYGFKVGPKCFYPAPKVHSAVTHFVMKEELPDVDPSLFFTLTRRAFQQRRKMLRGTLSEFGDVESALEEMGVRKEARPENLSLEEWLKLFSALKLTD